MIGGLNSLTQKGRNATRGRANAMLLAFYEATPSLGDTQLSSPTGKDPIRTGDFVKELPSAVSYHPKDTPPSMVDNLPIPAEEIIRAGSSYSVTIDRLVAQDHELAK